MAKSVGVSIDQRQMNSLMRNMLKLTKAVEGKRLDKTLEAGAEPVEVMATALAPVGKRGLLRRSISTQLKWDKGQRVAWVGPDYKMTAVGHLVEFGHRMYYGKLGSQDRKLLAGGKKTKAKPFMRPAFDIGGPEGARRMGRELGKSVEWQARRGNR